MTENDDVHKTVVQAYLRNTLGITILRAEREANTPGFRAAIDAVRAPLIVEIERLRVELSNALHDRDEARAERDATTNRFAGGEWLRDYGWRRRDSSMGQQGFAAPPAFLGSDLEATVRDIWTGPVRAVGDDHA